MKEVHTQGLTAEEIEGLADALVVLTSSQNQATKSGIQQGVLRSKKVVVENPDCSSIARRSYCDVVISLKCIHFIGMIKGFL